MVLSSNGKSLKVDSSLVTITELTQSKYVFTYPDGADHIEETYILN